MSHVGLALNFLCPLSVALYLKLEPCIWNTMLLIVPAIGVPWGSSGSERKSARDWVSGILGGTSTSNIENSFGIATPGIRLNTYF